MDGQQTPPTSPDELPGVELEIVPGHTNPRLWIFELKVKDGEVFGLFRLERWPQKKSPIFADGKGNFVVNNGKTWVHKSGETDKHLCNSPQPPSREAKYVVWLPPPTIAIWKLLPTDGGEPVDVEVTINYLDPVASPGKPQQVPRHLHVVIDAEVLDFAREFRAALEVLTQVFPGGETDITFSISSISPVVQGVHRHELPCLLWTRLGAVKRPANLHMKPQIKLTDLAVVCHPAKAKEAATKLCIQGSAQCAIAIEPRPKKATVHPLLGPLLALRGLFSEVFGHPQGCVNPERLHEFYTGEDSFGTGRLRQNGVHATAAVATQFQGVKPGASSTANVMVVEKAPREERGLKTEGILAAGSFQSDLLKTYHDVPIVDDTTGCYNDVATRMAHRLVKIVADGVDNIRVFVIPVSGDSSDMPE